MNINTHKSFFFCVMMLWINITLAQKISKVEIMNANTLEFDENLGKGAKRLIGNVIFKQDNVLMYSDSAYYYDNNSLDAFSNVHITQHDTVNLYGDLLKYNGNNKTAIVTGKIVKLLDKQMTLTTTELHYDMNSDIGFYTVKGKIINDKNTLTSQTGYYYSNQKNFYFKKDVVLKNPEYTMYCDTLRYNTVSETAFFNGPTKIKGETTDIYCENGWYDTKKDISQFNKKAFLSNKQQKIHGDSLYYNKSIGYGKALQNVEIADSAEKLTIKGNIAELFEDKDKSVVTEKAVMMQFLKDDTLYLHGDTLLATYDSTYFAIKKTKQDSLHLIAKKNKLVKEEKVKMNDSISATHRIIYTYHKVKFFKKDLQGVCDSLIYSSHDSLMHLFKNPVLWSEENQLTADKVKIKISNGKIYQLFLDNNAFIISKYDSTRYNQIKGRNMTGYFLDNELRKIKVIGNGQTVYYAKEDDNSLIGVNKAECTDMAIYFKNNKVQKLKMYTKPAGTMYPIKEALASDMLLKDFKWLNEFRTKNPEDIFNWREMESTQTKVRSVKGKYNKAQNN